MYICSMISIIVKCTVIYKVCFTESEHYRMRESVLPQPAPHDEGVSVVTAGATEGDRILVADIHHRLTPSQCRNVTCHPVLLAFKI